MPTPALAVRPIALVLCCAAGGAVAGDVTVELRRSGGALLARSVVQEGQAIRIEASPGLARVNILADTTTDIGAIEILGDSGGTIEIALGPDAYTPGSTKPLRFGEDFGGVTVLDPDQMRRTAFRGGIAGDLLGPIEVARVSRFEADGLLDAPITLLEPSRDGVTIFEFGGATPAGIVKLASGDLTRLISKGDFLGTLVVEDGSVLHRIDINQNGAEAHFLGDIIVGGTIPLLIGSGDVAGLLVADRIARIELDGTIGRADLPADVRIGDGGVDKIIAGGMFGELVVTGVAKDLIFGRVSDLPQAQGHVVGSVDIQSLPASTGRLGVGGDLDADVRIRSGVGVFKARNLAPIHVNGVLAEGRTVRIDRRIVGDTTDTPGVLIRTPGGLHGQIIVNAEWDPTQEDTGAAIADDLRVTRLDGVRVDLTPLPSYATPSADLGGGAIGGVPFGVHAGDVSVARVESSAELPFYGPVRLAPGAGSEAVLVERRPGGTNDDWETLATSAYDVIDAHGTDPGGAPSPTPRRLRVVHDFACGFEYRLSPMPELVWSDIEGRDGVPIAGGQRVVFTADDCPDEPGDNPGDQPGNGGGDGPGDGGDDGGSDGGQVDFFRILNELNRWMDRPADLNGDGFTDFFDLTLLLDSLTRQTG